MTIHNTEIKRFRCFQTTLLVLYSLNSSQYVTKWPRKHPTRHFSCKLTLAQCPCLIDSQTFGILHQTIIKHIFRKRNCNVYFISLEMSTNSWILKFSGNGMMTQILEISIIRLREITFGGG